MPCCVFSREYPRSLRCGREVESFEDLVIYLEERLADAGVECKTAFLEYNGRNKVLFGGF